MLTLFSSRFLVASTVFRIFSDNRNWSFNLVSRMRNSLSEEHDGKAFLSANVYEISPFYIYTVARRTLHRSTSFLRSAGFGCRFG